MRHLLTFPLATLLLTSCGQSNEAFVKACQKGVYEDHFSRADFGTLDRDSLKQMAGDVDRTDGYLSLKFNLVDGADPSAVTCRQKSGATYTNEPISTNWYKVDDARLEGGAYYDGWANVP